MILLPRPHLCCVLRTLLLSNAYPILELIGWMEDYLLALPQPFKDLHFSLIPVADGHGLSVSAPLLDCKYAPRIAVTKGSAPRDLKNILSFPGYDSRFDPVAVSKPAWRIDEICNDVHPFFLDT